MITHILQQDAKVFTQTKDKHGDFTLTDEQDVKCRFRYITELDKGTNNEGMISDAIIWFDPDVTVLEGNVIFTEDKYWRVNRLVKARRLSGPTIEFLKAYVDKYEYGG